MSLISRRTIIIALFSGLIGTMNQSFGAPNLEQKPTLVSISPSEGPLDTKVTLKIRRPHK